MSDVGYRRHKGQCRCPPMLVCNLRKSINPFSHYVICVSRLTVSGHMRHPLKANLGENEDEFCVCLCVRLPKHVPRNDSKQSGGGNFLRFSL